jgi:hypothetical protein
MIETRICAHFYYGTTIYKEPSSFQILLIPEVVNDLQEWWGKAVM